MGFSLGGFTNSLTSAFDPQAGQRRVYNKSRGDIREATNRYLEMVMQRQGIDPAAFAQAAQQAVAGGGLQGIQGQLGAIGQGYAALPGQFFGQGYANDLQSAILGQAAQGALGAGRSAAALGGRRGVQFGGAAEQARRAMTDISAQTGANLASARATTEQARSGLAQAGLQGQLSATQAQSGLGQFIANLLAQGSLGGLNAEQGFRQSQMGALAGLGSQAIGSLGGIGQAYLGNSGTGWAQKMIQDWGGRLLSLGG